MLSRVSNPILIVGSSRSGTNLCRQLLNRHADLCIGGETYYFDDLRRRVGRQAREGLTGSNREKCEQYLLRLNHSSYEGRGGVKQDDFSAETLRSASLELGTGSDHVFEAFALLHTELTGSVRWGEKTPRHVFQIDAITEAFPSSQIICTIRDPRAVVASYKNWVQKSSADPDPQYAKRETRRRKRTYDPLLSTLMWRGVAAASLNAYEKYGSQRVRLLKFEDMVTRPKETLRDLCEWLGHEYSDDMLDVVMLNSSFNQAPVEAGIHADASVRWRDHLTPGETAVVQSVCRDYLGRFGYEPIDVPPSRGKIALCWARLPWMVTRAFLANHSRIAKPHEYLIKRLRMATKQACARENTNATT